MALAAQPGEQRADPEHLVVRCGATATTRPQVEVSRTGSRRPTLPDVEGCAEVLVVDDAEPATVAQDGTGRATGDRAGRHDRLIGARHELAPERLEGRARRGSDGRRRVTSATAAACSASRHSGVAPGRDRRGRPSSTPPPRPRRGPAWCEAGPRTGRPGRRRARPPAAARVQRAPAGAASTAPRWASACASGRRANGLAQGAGDPLGPPTQQAATPAPPCQKPGRSR